MSLKFDDSLLEEIGPGFLNTLREIVDHLHETGQPHDQISELVKRLEEVHPTRQASQKKYHFAEPKGHIP